MSDMISIAALQEMADRLEWESTPAQRCSAGSHQFGDADLKGYALCVHCSRQEAVVQPRERAVPCRRCGLDSRRKPRRLTFNLNGLCDEHQGSTS